MRFQDRVAIVTGGAQGIGAGCAQVLAAEGGRIAILDRDAPAAETLAAELRRLHSADSAEAFICDVADTAALTAEIQAVHQRFGRIDCLVNNAGIHPPATTLEETTADELRRVFEINVLSNFFAAQAALPYLRQTKGTIINMCSMTAVLGQEHSTAYAASKGAQLSFTKALALELGREGIRVNAILPSNIDTPLMQSWAATLPDPDAALQRIAELQVFGRMGTIEEIGRVVLFLATEDSSFITGQGIEVEGGASLDY